MGFVSLFSNKSKIIAKCGSTLIRRRFTHTGLCDDEWSVFVLMEMLSLIHKHLFQEERKEKQQEHFLSDSTQSGRRMCGLQAMLAVMHFKATRLQSYCNHITFFNNVTFYCANVSNYIKVHVTGVTKVGQPGGYKEKHKPPPFLQ